MADNLPTVWPADPHTLAKHAILRNYLSAWFPILARQAARLRQEYGFASKREILFVDAFAGPGEYMDGQPGSPLIAIDVALSHAVEFPYPVRLFFNEQRVDRYQHLKLLIERERARRSSSNNAIIQDPLCADCTHALAKLIEQYESQHVTFGPALVFLDQFGYSAVPMELIVRILSHSECEVFALLDFRDMNRWIGDETKAEAFDRAYGSSVWMAARSLPADQQQSYLMDTYVTALRKKAGANYVTSFSMFDRNDRLIYRLIFCTNDLRGLEEMKKAMWKVDKSGECKFSDRDAPGQLQLLNVAFDQNWLADELQARLSERVMTAEEVKEFVLVETPCYLFKEALQKLESEPSSGVDVVAKPQGRRKGSFPDENLAAIRIKFGRRLI